MNETIPYTLAIFDHLCADLPPLVPSELHDDVKHAREQLRHNYGLTKKDVEETIVAFGKKLWPYRKAFDEFVDVYEGKLGEIFLQTQLPRATKKRFEEFKTYGGDFRALHSGAPATFFTADERVKLCEALVTVRRHIRDHTRQAVLSVDRTRYEKRIVEFQLILDDIEKRLDSLRRMADDEQEHPELASEMRSQVQAFEHGLCLLGPNHSYEAVCKAEEHFHGRKVEKKMRR